MSDPRLVSVVTCFLDAERFLEEAVESVFAQTHPAWELVLVDDGSSDRSGAIARRYERRHPDRVRCIAHAGGRNLGKSASRNAGVAASRGPLVAFLDADDVLLPHALRTLAGAISRTPEAALAYGRTRMWFSWPGNPEGRDERWDFDSALPAPEGTVIPAGGLLAALARDDDALPSVCSAIVRREALERVGGWEPSFVDVYDDFVLWAKVTAERPVLIVDETLSRYRKHPDSSCEQATRSGEWSPVDLSVSRYRYLTWMERWLTERRLGDEAAWRALDAELAPYRHPTAPAALDTALARDGGSHGVRGSLDHPRPGTRTRSHRVPIGGWAVGTEQRALAVELVVGGRTVRRLALDGRRPDVAATLGTAGDRHGFSMSLPLAGAQPLALDVVAVLEDQARVPLAHVAARRVLRAQDVRAGATPVSAVVVCSTEAAALAATVESVLAQDHRPIEVVVVDDGSASALEEIALAYPGVRYVRAEGEGLVAARRAGLRRSSGEVVLFLAPRERLHPRAVSAALARLAARPECGFVAGSGGERPLDRTALLHAGPADGAALYRRIALSAAGGIPDAPAGTEDWALQLHVARVMPGIAIADPLLAARRPPTAAAPPAAQLPLLRAERRRGVRDARERGALRHAERRAGSTRLRRLPPPLRRARGDGRGLILLYHRVAELDADPWALAVARERFAEQLDVLRAHAHPLPLHELVARAARGRLPRRAVAVTFDDGYRDNLDAALPELERAGVGATLFLAAGAVDRERELWWDELERILLAPRALPERLAVAVDGRGHAVAFGDTAKTWDAATARRHRGWRVGQPPPTARHRAYAELWSALQPLDERPRAAVLDELRAWAGDAGGVRESHRTLDAAGVAALAGSGVFDVGGHTITHPRLARQRRERQAHEIAGGKTLVEQLTGRPARLFAYPFGGLDDYTATTATLVAEAGYAGACATWEGAADAGCDAWQLPRMTVGDVGGDSFAEQLATWFGER